MIASFTMLFGFAVAWVNGWFAMQALTDLSGFDAFMASGSVTAWLFALLLAVKVGTAR